MNLTTDPTEERNWCMLAHLAGILNLFMPIAGGAIGAGIVWLIYKDKSKQVAFHSLQSLVFQAVQMIFVLVVVGGTWVVGFIFSFVTIGFGALIAVPAMIFTFFLGGAVLLAGTIYSIYGAVRVNNGEDFRYKWIGDWTARQMNSGV
jgi:uncharacterized Tic20 family protein